MIESNEMNAAGQTFTAGSAESYAHCPRFFHSANIKMEGRERLWFEWLPASNSEIQVQSELDDAVAVK